MSKAHKLLFLGIWVAILPHLGFPSTWKNVFFLFTGLALMHLGYTLYSESRPKVVVKNTIDSFSENTYYNVDSF